MFHVNTIWLMKILLFATFLCSQLFCALNIEHFLSTHDERAEYLFYLILIFFFLKTYTSSQHSSENVIAWTKFFDTLFFFSLNYEWECWMRMLNANVNVNAKMIAKFNLVINFFYPRFYFLQTLQKLDVVLFLFLCYKWWWCK